MIGGEKVAIALKKVGLNTVFGLVGNQISPILVHLREYGIEFVGTRHEQAAVHMADAWAQCKRSCGIAIVSGGPGFTNTINGIAKAYYAETPLLIITGSVVSSQRDKGSLQDMDQLSVVKGLCKWGATVYDGNRIEEYVMRAVEVAMTGKKGPVVLEIPINILRQKVKSDEEVSFEHINCIRKNIVYEKSDIVKSVFKGLISAEKPLILLGDEVYYANVDEKIEFLVNKLRIPVATVNKARGIISDDNQYCIGNGRILENGPQIYALQEADFLLVVGVRWDYQMDSFEAPIFSDKQKIVYITENSELVMLRQNVEVYKTNINGFIQQMCEVCKNEKKFENINWNKRLDEHIEEFWRNIYKENKVYEEFVSPLNLLQHISQFIDEDVILVLDGSNAMFWAGLLLKATTVGQIIIAPDGQHGSMGCGIPLALGAKVANPDKNVLLYTGDGSVGFNLSEFDTSIRYNLPITVIVHNDGKWGLCETTQKILYENVCGTVIREVNYAKIAYGFGGYGEVINNDIEVKNKITKDTIFRDKLMCFDAKVEGSRYSPGLISFNERLEKMK